MVLITPEQIGSILAIIPLPHSFAELDERVSLGLPKNALKASVDRVCQCTEERKHLLHQIIPEATYKRRKDKLTAEESGRAERLARIYATAQYVWNSDDDARVFLHAPHPMLQGHKPLDVAMTELGARRVEELLWKLFYGMTA